MCSDYERGHGSLGQYEVNRNTRRPYYGSEVCSCLRRLYFERHLRHSTTEDVSDLRPNKNRIDTNYARVVFIRSGYRVITTCSPKNFKLVEEYGAEKAFDHHSPTCGEDIRAYTKNTLEYVLDIITEARTIRHCYAAIGRGGGKYVGFELLPDDLMATMRKTVKADWILGLEMTGLEIDLPGAYYRKENPELHVWFQELIKRYAALYERGKLKTHPIQVNKGGLEKVIDGIGAMQRKEVSGLKMVYPL